MIARIRYRCDDEGNRHRVVVYNGKEGYMARWTRETLGED